jgi:hypothetical protein
MIIVEHGRILQNSSFFYILVKSKHISGPKLQHVLTDQRTNMHPMLCHDETVRLNETVFFFQKTQNGQNCVIETSISSHAKQ